MDGLFPGRDGLITVRLLPILVTFPEYREEMHRLRRRRAAKRRLRRAKAYDFDEDDAYVTKGADFWCLHGAATVSGENLDVVKT